jgi:glycosyltransferase involved in cell wall biosynthesis
MENKIKISIIIPVYNTEQYLRQCLDSVINQTLKNIEIVIVNDGSTDNSLNILQEYQKKYSHIKVINQINKGYSEVRNIGLQNTTGDYIGFVDSDDFIEENMFEKLINKAIETNADIVSCNYYMVYNKNKKEEIRAADNSKQIEILENSSYRFTGAESVLLDEAFVWNRIYKRNFLINNNIKFDKDAFFMEDTLFHRKALICSTKIVYIKDILYFYRVKRVGAQTTLKDGRNFSVFFICDSLFDLIYSKKLLNCLPWMRYLLISLLCLGYERIEKKYKEKYFIKIHEYLKKYNINKNLKDTLSVYKQFENNCISYIKYYVLKFLYFMLVKFGLNKKFFMFNICVELKKVLRNFWLYCNKLFMR